MKIKVYGWLDYPEETMHGDDPESFEWFMKILYGKDLVLMDTGDLGDVIGKFTIDEVKG